MSDPLLEAIFHFGGDHLCHQAVSLVDGLGDRRGDPLGVLIGDVAHPVGVDAQRLGCARKVALCDVANCVASAHLHRQFRVVVHLVGFEHEGQAGEVVEWGKADAGAEVQQRVVLCMGVSTGGEPVVDERLGEGLP